MALRVRIHENGRHEFHNFKNSTKVNEAIWLLAEDKYTQLEDGSFEEFYLDKIVDGKYVIDTVKKAEAQKVIDDELADRARSKAMLDGVDYNGTVVSLTKSDGDGLVQVKSGFELGLTDTVIHFENGSKLPMNVADFPEFALWFVNERNKFFTIV